MNTFLKKPFLLISLLSVLSPLFCQILFEAGIDSNHIETQFIMEDIDTYQDQSQWCWAAVISMAFGYHGYHVSQQTIVENIKGININLPAYGFEMTTALSSEWVDDINGRRFKSSCDIYDIQQMKLRMNNKNVIAELNAGHPLVYCTLGHAMLLTKVWYYQDYHGFPWVVKASVFDPWPSKGKRLLTSPQEISPYYVATVRITEIKEPTKSVPSSIANIHQDKIIEPVLSNQILLNEEKIGFYNLLWQIYNGETPGVPEGKTDYLNTSAKRYFDVKILGIDGISRSIELKNRKYILKLFFQGLTAKKLMETISNLSNFSFKDFKSFLIFSEENKINHLYLVRNEDLQLENVKTIDVDFSGRNETVVFKDELNNEYELDGTTIQISVENLPQLKIKEIIDKSSASNNENQESSSKIEYFKILKNLINEKASLVVFNAEFGNTIFEYTTDYSFFTLKMRAYKIPGYKYFIYRINICLIEDNMLLVHNENNIWIIKLSGKDSGAIIMTLTDHAPEDKTEIFLSFKSEADAQKVKEILKKLIKLCENSPG